MDGQWRAKAQRAVLGGLAVVAFSIGASAAPALAAEPGPVAVANWDLMEISVGAPVTFNVLDNDDLRGLPFTEVVLRDAPDEGSVVLAGDGTATYTPEPGYFGRAWFTYVIVNENGTSNTAAASLRMRGTLHYDANGGASAPEAVTSEDPVHTVADAPTPPEGYRFEGWNTQLDASGTAYHPRDELTLTQGSTTLYAQWTRVSALLAPVAHDDVYTVMATPELRYTIFSPADNDEAPSDAYIRYVRKQSSPENGMLYPVVLNQPGGGIAYTPLPWFVGEDTFTYVAISDAGVSNVATITVRVISTLHYDANGGEGAPTSVTSAQATRPVTDVIPTRVGYDFAGWSRSPEGSEDPLLHGGDSIPVGLAEHTLYAQWTVVVAPSPEPTTDSTTTPTSVAPPTSSAATSAPPVTAQLTSLPRTGVEPSLALGAAAALVVLVGASVLTVARRRTRS